MVAKVDNVETAGAVNHDVAWIAQAVRADASRIARVGCEVARLVEDTRGGLCNEGCVELQDTVIAIIIAYVETAGAIHGHTNRTLEATRADASVIGRVGGKTTRLAEYT